MARIEDMYYPPREPGFALKQEIKALQAQLDALRPVPVDQVPEAWKDGRGLLILFKSEEIGYWWEINSWSLIEAAPEFVVEVRPLPPTPQEPDNA